MTDSTDLPTSDQIRSFLTEQEWLTLMAVCHTYGNTVEDALNGLHRTAAVLAIWTGVEPNRFAMGVKEHWDRIAGQLNTVAEKEPTDD